MKKFAIALTALAVMAAVASAAVYSQNAVGFINKEVGKGEIVALTIPFNDINSDTGTILFKNTQMAQDAAVGSIVYFWTGTSWSSVPKGRNGFNTSKELKAGEMFFFKPAADQVITMNGEVPDEATIDVIATGGANISALGNPYPVSTTFKDSALADAATTASIAFFWTGTSWASVPKGRNGFNTTKVLAPGEGFFFKTVATDGDKVWKVTKEYDFP